MVLYQRFANEHHFIRFLESCLLLIYSSGYPQIQVHLDFPHFVKLRWEKLTQQRSSSPICINWYKNADTGSPFQAPPIVLYETAPFSSLCFPTVCASASPMAPMREGTTYIYLVTSLCLSDSVTLGWLCICCGSLNHLAAPWLNAFQLEPTTHFSLPAGHSWFSELPPAVRHLRTLLWDGTAISQKL